MRQAQRTIERAQRQAEYEAGLSYVKAGVAMVTAATAMSEADFAAWLEPLGLDQEQVRKCIELAQTELERQKALKAEWQAQDAERHQMRNELVNAGYRALVTKYHPDTGGSHDEMVRLNKLRDDPKI
jgi:hypothetical protein